MQRKYEIDGASTRQRTVRHKTWGKTDWSERSFRPSYLRRPSKSQTDDRTSCSSNKKYAVGMLAESALLTKIPEVTHTHTYEYKHTPGPGVRQRGSLQVRIEESCNNRDHEYALSSESGWTHRCMFRRIVVVCVVDSANRHDHYMLLCVWCIVCSSALFAEHDFTC